MGRIGRLVKTAIETFIIQTVETRLGLNQTAKTFNASGDDSPPLENDRIVLVKVDGTGHFAAVGVMTVSQGAKAGEKILFSRDPDGEIMAKISMLNDGTIGIDSPADLSVAIEGDAVIGADGEMILSADKVLKIDGQKVTINGGGTNKNAARKGDQVKIQIPPLSVIISVSGGSGAPAVGVLNPKPIDCMGKIQSGSGTVEIGG